MKQSLMFWIIAFIITAVVLVYQRRTGPTYPLDGKTSIAGTEIAYHFERTHAGQTDHTVALKTNDRNIKGVLEWKRFKTADDWTKVEMAYRNDSLTASFPGQPPAGKIEYRIILTSGNETALVPENRTVVLRFRGEVPAAVLILHIAVMFASLIFSTRAGLETFSKEPKLKKLIYWTIGTALLGGVILGPLMQWYSFGAFWTGWPFGSDLTDNKTALMILLWIAAALSLRMSKKPKRWVFIASVMTLVVFLIPHSILGSELDYAKADTNKPAALIYHK